jgi:hypothetical protein
MKRRRIAWLAGEDGIAHAIVARHALCGARAVTGPIWAWPTLTRCQSCAAALARHGPGRYGAGETVPR